MEYPEQRADAKTVFNELERVAEFRRVHNSGQVVFGVSQRPGELSDAPNRVKLGTQPSGSIGAEKEMINLG